MNFNLYIFGRNQGTYNQYPNDYTSSVLASISSDVTNSKAIITRDQNLMHYIYAENIGNHNVIGLCLIFNKAYIKHVSKLFNFLRGLLEATLLKQGKIIHYNNEGDIEFVSTNLSDDIKSIDYVKALVNSKLDSDNNYFGISELTTTFNGLHNSEIIDGSTANTEIIKLQQKFNTIIIEYNRGIEEDLTKKVIQGLQAQVSNLNQKILSQEKIISQLEKTKKQYKKVMFLIFVLLCACAGLYFLYVNLNDTQERLDAANNTISEKESIIESKNSTISDLRNSVNSLENNLNREVEAKEKIESSLQSICTYTPFAVTSCEVNANQFKFDYFCPEEKEVTVTLKAVNERNNETVTSTHSLTFYKGTGSKTLDFYRRLNTSQYYYVILMYNGHIVAGQRW